MSPPKDPARRPKSSDHPDAGIALHLFGAVIVGILVALATGEHWATVGFWATLLAAAVGTFLLIFWIQHQWLIPNPEPELMVNDQARLTNAITSSRRSAYAISSNWLGLWRSSTFRYYLHLDTAVSLIAYSESQASPLERLSTDLRDQQVFFDDGLALVEELGKGEARLHKHRLRLLIYPQWVYDNYSAEIMHLIRSHSAARIPCLPLVAEELYEALYNEDHKQMSHLIETLKQTPVDKVPPLSRLQAWRVERAIRRGKIDSWKPAFPDMLLIDTTLPSGGVWWYSADGHVNHWGSQSQTNRELAMNVFKTICKHAPAALWANYAPEILGGVAVAPPLGKLQSETFFARHHYHDWLEWIKANAENDSAARSLSSWLNDERQAMSKGLVDYFAGHPNGQNEVQILDIGCGFGNDLVDILETHPNWRGVGVDINSSMLSEASRLAKQQSVQFRANFMPEDAATLDSCDDAEFDFAICMTNTLGNLPKNKQNQLMRRLKRVLKPGGQVYFSTYTEGSHTARLASYEAIGLDVKVEGSRIVAAEGLESEAFSQTSLRRLIVENGLELVGEIEPVAGIGLKAIAQRPSGDPA